VERVELKDISLPESMKRSMSRQAEAERGGHGPLAGVIDRMAGGSQPTRTG